MMEKNKVLDILEWHRQNLAVSHGSDYSVVLALEEAINMLSAPHKATGKEFIRELNRRAKEEDRCIIIDIPIRRKYHQT